MSQLTIPISRHPCFRTKWYPSIISTYRNIKLIDSSNHLWDNDMKSKHSEANCYEIMQAKHGIFPHVPKSFLRMYWLHDWNTTAYVWMGIVVTNHFSISISVGLQFKFLPVQFSLWNKSIFSVLAGITCTGQFYS